MLPIAKLKNFSGTTGASDVVIALSISIAREIKAIPFNGKNFRFGLGSITFLLLILMRPFIPLIRTSFITGITVVCFRLIGNLTNEPLSTLIKYEPIPIIRNKVGGIQWTSHF